MLRKIFGPKNDDVNEEYGILHNEEFRYVYRSPSVGRIVKYMRLDRLEETRSIEFWLVTSLLLIDSRLINGASSTPQVSVQ